MSYDLQGGLHDLAGDPVTAPDLSLPGIVAHLRHARRVRTASYSAVGMAAVAAIALAVTASGLGGAPDPAPPALTAGPDDDGSFSGWSPTPSPTPTPAATPTATPDGAAAEPPAACGSTVDVSELPAPEYLAIGEQSRQEYGPQLAEDPNDRFRMAFGITRISGAQAVASARIVTAVAATTGPSGWTVEGVLTREPEQVTNPVSPVPGAFPVAADLRFESCGGGRLDGDMYVLLVTVEVTRVDGSTVAVVVPAHGYIGAGPGTNQIIQPEASRTGDGTGRLTTARLEVAGLPSCGEAYSRSSVPGAGLALTGTASFAGHRVAAEVVLTHAGLDVADGSFVAPIVTVTRDGVVVGQTQDLPYSARALKAWSAGSTFTMYAALLDSACDPMDADLPPGSYEVWVMVPVWVSSDLSATPRFFYGGPWSVTVPDASQPSPTPEPSATEQPATEPPATEAPATEQPATEQPATIP